MAQLDLADSLASPTGPFVVFVARSSRCHNGANIHGQKLWLRGTIPPVEDTFKEKYGTLGNRPYAYCLFVHGANDPMTSEHETIRYLTSFMNKAWAAECGAIFVFSGCAGLTTDATTFINLFKGFKDVNVQIKVYVSFEHRQYGHFWEVNPHKVCDIFEGKPIPEDTPVDDSEWFVTNFRLQHDLKRIESPK